MSTKRLAIAALALLCACDPTKNAEEKKKSLGQATGDITHDTRVLERAQGAVNGALQANGDCEALKAALPEADQAIKEAEAEIRTPGGQATLDSIKAQLRGARQACF